MQDKKRYPKPRDRVIDGCDHWLIVENPGAVDKTPAEFLDTIKVDMNYPNREIRGQIQAQ
jgi:hypothetical protein